MQELLLMVQRLDSQVRFLFLFGVWTNDSNIGVVGIHGESAESKRTVTKTKRGNGTVIGLEGVHGGGEKRSEGKTKRGNGTVLGADGDRPTEVDARAANDGTAIGLAGTNLISVLSVDQ